MLMRILMFMLMFLMVGCAAKASGSSLSPIDGDVQRGEAIFRTGTNGAPACISCHALAPGGFSFGPMLTGIGERAAQRVDGLSADDYIRQSILEPSTYVVPGYRSLMYPNYASALNEQNLADLIAFLNSLPA